MTIEEIKIRKRVGDYETAARRMGITSNHLQQIIKRSASKRYNDAIEQISIVIESRELLERNQKA